MTSLTCPDCAATVDEAVLTAGCEYIEVFDEPGRVLAQVVLTRPADQSWHLKSCPVLSEALKTAAVDQNWTSIDPDQLRVRKATTAEKLILAVLAGRPASSSWSALAQVKRVNALILVGLTGVSTNPTSAPSADPAREGSRP